MINIINASNNNNNNNNNDNNNNNNNNLNDNSMVMVMAPASTNINVVTPGLGRRLRKVYFLLEEKNPDISKLQFYLPTFYMKRFAQFSEKGTIQSHLASHSR